MITTVFRNFISRDSERCFIHMWKENEEPNFMSQFLESE